MQGVLQIFPSVYFVFDCHECSQECGGMCDPSNKLQSVTDVGSMYHPIYYRIINNSWTAKNSATPGSILATPMKIGWGHLTLGRIHPPIHHEDFRLASCNGWAVFCGETDILASPHPLECLVMPLWASFFFCSLENHHSNTGAFSMLYISLLCNTVIRPWPKYSLPKTAATPQLTPKLDGTMENQSKPRKILPNNIYHKKSCLPTS
jgi:hypothetical protein